ncbi:HK97-gp10 family putative phage morphogenesis protein, partial [Escherichia coli]
MSALYERSQLTQVMISSAPATAETMDKAEYLRLDCTIKEVQFTAGQKQDIDVTTLCSTEQENINGLGASSEISMSGNFYLNQAQNALRDAYDNDFYWRFVEMGTVNMPPHPFVRPAFDVRSEQAAQVAIARMNRAIDEVLRR